MRRLVAMLVLMCVAGGCSSPSAPVNLADLRGWDIVVAPNAKAAALYAAQEFADLYAQAAGVRLAIVTQAKEREGHVYIGTGPSALGTGPGPLPTMCEEDFYLQAMGRQIVICGGSARGTLYGVYCFMEDHLGVRFLTADHTHVPKIAGAIMVGPLTYVHHPPLEYRYTYYGENNASPAFAARLRLNAVPGLGEKYGGAARMGLINHSFNNQLSSQKYGREHPEYFSLIDGNRRANVARDWDSRGTQLCVTNPDVRRIVTQAVLAELAKAPARRNISVSQNDNRNYCRCENCQAVNDREGSPMGAQLELVNCVAAAVEANFPGAMVGTLSYQYTRKPPAHLRPRANVQIQLCSIECCQYHAIDDANCPKNVEFCRDMEGWGAICDNIYVWNYDTNFGDYLLPCANIRAIAPNVRYFVAHHAKGLFMQAAGNTLGAEFSDLRNYVISALLWDPNRDGNALIDEFLNLHYGPAAGPIRRFIDFTHDRVAATGKHPRCHGTAGDFGLDQVVADEGLKDFAEALTACGGDPVLRARVEKASLTALRAAIEPVWEKALPMEALTPPAEPAEIAQVAREFLHRFVATPAPASEQIRPLAHEFFRLARKYNVKMVNEQVSTEDALKHMKQTLRVADKDDL